MIPHSRLVWTNEESDEGPVTTVTFAEKGGKTLLVMHELYPSKEALDAGRTGRRMRWERRSSNWTSFSSPWARREDDMLRRDFLKTATATAVLGRAAHPASHAQAATQAATLPVQAKETPAMSNANFADVNGQHIFYSVHGAGKPLILLHGGINPDSFGSNRAELAKGRQVIAVHLQAHGRTPDTDRPLRHETLGDDVAALIGHLNLGKADVMGYSLGSGVALQTAIRHPDVVDRLVLVSGAMRKDGFYPEGVAAFNQLEANAATYRPWRQGIAARAGLSRCRLDEPLQQGR